MPATVAAKDQGGHHHHTGPLNRFRKGSAELITDVMKAPAAAAGAALRSLGIKPSDQVPARSCGLQTTRGELRHRQPACAGLHGRR